MGGDESRPVQKEISVSERGGTGRGCVVRVRVTGLLRLSPAPHPPR